MKATLSFRKLMLGSTLALGLLPPAMGFVVSDETRRIPPERLEALRGLQAAMVPASAYRAVFWHDRDYEAHAGGAMMDGVSQSLMVGTRTFATGAGTAALVMLLDASANAGSRNRIGRAVDNYFHAMGPTSDFQVEQAAWRASVLRALEASGRVSSLADDVRREREERLPRGGGCPEPDNCLEVEPVWGFSSDGAHIDFMVLLRIWSPHLRKPGRRARREPDYANAVIFRSGAIRFPEPKTAADREALLQSARAAFERLGLPALKEKMKSRRPQVASAARRQAFPLLAEHAARVKQAKADEWADGARRFRRAQLWAAQDGEPVLAAFAAAAEATPRLLEVELSSAGQSLKEPRPLFLMRRPPKDAHVVEGVERQIVYLDDGRLVSRPVGEPSVTPWSLRVSEDPNASGLPGD